MRRKRLGLTVVILGFRFMKGLPIDLLFGRRSNVLTGPRKMSLTDAQYQEHVREDMPMDLPMEIA
jgi:hypothetical protein